MKPRAKHIDICSAILEGGYQRNKALQGLYSDEKIKKSVLKVVLNNGGNYDDAVDIFQEAIILFDRKVRENEFQQKSKESTYIVSLAKYLWLNERRKKDRVDNTDDFTSFDLIEGDTPEKHMLDQELIQEINILLKKAGKNCYEILTLWKESYTLKQITEKLNFTSYNALRKRKYRCLKELMNTINDSAHLKHYFTL